jgi:hypothetical protein
VGIVEALRQGVGHARSPAPPSIHPGNLVRSGRSGLSVGKGERFAACASHDEGVTALKFSLTRFYSERKLDEVFKKYAPATDDNDPEHYIVLVKKFGGLDSTRTIGSLTDAELGKFIGAIEREMKPYVFTLPMLLASADLFWARSLFVVLRVRGNALVCF